MKLIKQEELNADIDDMLGIKPMAILSSEELNSGIDKLLGIDEMGDKDDLGARNKKRQK